MGGENMRPIMNQKMSGTSVTGSKSYQGLAAS